MKKALYTMTAVAALSLSTLAASAQIGAHTDDIQTAPHPQAVLTLSVGDTVLSLFLNFVLSL